jgi:putative toxin-antitoxin system antitoxin component (TIGR02293 family)
VYGFDTVGCAVSNPESNGKNWQERLRALIFREYVLNSWTNVYLMSDLILKIRTKLTLQIFSILKDWKKERKASKITPTEYTLDDFMADKMAIISLIQEGVPYTLFDTIQGYTPLEEDDWTDILSLSSKSLQRYKQSGKKFGRLQSEKIIEMAEVANIGLDVFGNMEQFRLWLGTPNFALSKRKPVELLKDSYGKELVVGELTRINYGILA